MYCCHSCGVNPRPATAHTALGRSRGSVMSHIRMVLSTLPLASHFPSGENATEFTALVWPVRGSPSWVPVLASQIRMVLSPLPLASHLPSGEKATDHTTSVWPV